MRIFHVSADRGIPPDGTKGASIHRRELIHAFRSRSHEVIEFSRRPGPGTTDPRNLEDAASASGPPDIIYERYSIGHTHGLEVAGRLGVPFVLEVNAPLLVEAERHRNYRPTLADTSAEIELFRRSTVVRSVTSWTADYVRQRRRHDKGLVVIGNGHDPEAYPDPPTFGDKPTIAFLGHPKPWHGAEKLVPLMALLAQRGVDASLLVIGGGPGADTVMAAARTAGVADRIEITGPVDSAGVSAALGRSWVGLAPYPPMDDFYFSPLKIADYLGAGLPVVSSDLGDLRTMIGDGGTVVDAASLDELARAVAEFVTDRNHARHVGSLGRRHARSALTWDRVASAIDDSVHGLGLGVSA